MTEQQQPITGIVPPRKPYEPPEIKIIDVANLMDNLEKTEGELYKEFNALADQVSEFLAQLEQFETKITALSEGVDKAGLDLAKAQFIVEVKARGGQKVQDQG